MAGSQSGAVRLYAPEQWSATVSGVESEKLFDDPLALGGLILCVATLFFGIIALILFARWEHRNPPVPQSKVLKPEEQPRHSWRSWFGSWFSATDATVCEFDSVISDDRMNRIGMVVTLEEGRPVSVARRETQDHMLRQGSFPFEKRYSDSQGVGRRVV